MAAQTAADALSELDRPVQFLKGVGPRRAELLRRLGILTARDLLLHIPRRYEDATTLSPIGRVAVGQEVTVKGRIISKGVLPTRKGLRIFQAVLRDETGLIECAWPGQPFLDRKLRKGDLVIASGVVRFYHGRQLQPREYTVLAPEGEDDQSSGAVFSVYPATEGLSHGQIRALIGDNLDVLLAHAADDEIFDPALLERLGLPAYREALELLHRPLSIADAVRGRRRLAFEELFFLQLLHAQARQAALAQSPGIAFGRTNRLLKPLYLSLPFELTKAQQTVLRQINEDMGSPQRMTRLLQGDVGSGKTIVAIFAMLRAVEDGYQAAIMAPTELLAEQHYGTLRKVLGGLPVRVDLLTGALAAGERRRTLQRIVAGETHIVVGTHALIQDAVRYHRLGLAVVDEQHRFGVKQRLALVTGGSGADILVMSATPIPRSLALTLYGDLDISVLGERPPGRQPVKTGLRDESAREQTWEFVRKQLRAGRQGYVVYPLVEESEKVDLRAATEQYERLRAEPFAGFSVGLIHGQMPADQKDAVMKAFAGREIDLLVSTTVIEVGIDVPNATVMVIEHAERFGLSQLHQLRGRVGRGAQESFCILLAAGFSAAERLRVFVRTDDGFEIARADMRLRGEGDLFGHRQSGAPRFRFANLDEDEALLLQAREEARQLVHGDPQLDNHPKLRAALEARYRDQTNFFRVG